MSLLFIHNKVIQFVVTEVIVVVWSSFREKCPCLITLNVFLVLSRGQY